MVRWALSHREDDEGFDAAGVLTSWAKKRGRGAWSERENPEPSPSVRNLNGRLAGARIPLPFFPCCRRDPGGRSEEHTSELQSRQYLVCRLLLEKKTPRGDTILEAPLITRFLYHLPAGEELSVPASFGLFQALSLSTVDPAVCSSMTTS